MLTELDIAAGAWPYRAEGNPTAREELAALRTALASATARGEDMELMLRHAMECGVEEREWFGCVDGETINLITYVPPGYKESGDRLEVFTLNVDKHTWLPQLTTAARAALAETRKEGK